MKLLSLIFLCFLLYACSSAPDNKVIQSNYAFNIDKLVDQQIADLQHDSICKVLLDNTIIVERVKIEVDKIKKDLQELKNYDINKPAFKNVFDVNENDSITTFRSKDANNSIQQIVVYGKTTMPSNIKIEIKNQNNLYESSKLIDWQYNDYIRIKTIQKVKAMRADTIDVISYLNGNCATTSSILSTGK